MNKYLRSIYGRRDREFISAFIAGVELFAWWRDGIQYVDTTGTTLKQAKLEVVDSLAFDCDKEDLLQKVKELTSE